MNFPDGEERRASVAAPAAEPYSFLFQPSRSGWQNAASPCHMYMQCTFFSILFFLFALSRRFFIYRSFSFAGAVHNDNIFPVS